MPRYLAILIVLLVGLSACSQRQSLQQKIEGLESQLETEDNPVLANELSDTYLQYTERFPEDTLLNSRYLYRRAGLAYRMQDMERAIADIHRALEQYYSSDNSRNHALFLANIYQEDLRKPNVSYTIQQAINIAFPQGLEGSDLMLPENLEPVSARLDTMRSQIFNESTYSVNFQLANDYITSVEEFARVAPRQETTPGLLFRAAEIARSIQTFSKSIELFDWLEAKYPGHEREAQAMFLKAFTLDDGLRDYDQARIAYEAFLEKYPEDDFADDARFSLQNLGKDVNELIEGFEQDATEENQ